MKKYLKLIAAMAFAMSFSTQAFASNEVDEETSDLVMNEEATDELAMSKKSSADTDEYDYRGNPISGKKAKRKKGAYPSPISKQNTSSSAEEEVDPEESVY